MRALERGQASKGRGGQGSFRPPLKNAVGELIVCRFCGGQGREGGNLRGEKENECKTRLFARIF